MRCATPPISPVSTMPSWSPCSRGCRPAVTWPNARAPIPSCVSYGKTTPGSGCAKRSAPRSAASPTGCAPGRWRYAARQARCWSRPPAPPATCWSSALGKGPRRCGQPGAGCAGTACTMPTARYLPSHPPHWPGKPATAFAAGRCVTGVWTRTAPGCTAKRDNKLPATFGSWLTVAAGAGQGRAMNGVPLDALVTRMLSRSPFDYRVAADDTEREIAYRLRGATVLDRGWRTADDLPGGMERDRYDDRAIQVIGWEGDVAMSTGRVVLPP